MDFETIVFTIIANSGEAKSACMEAIAYARQGDFEKAAGSLYEANNKLLKAHECQTALIQAEAQGKEIKVTLLLMHAQDHLMNTVTIRDLAGEFIDMYKTLGKKQQEE